MDLNNGSFNDANEGDVRININDDQKKRSPLQILVSTLARLQDVSGRSAFGEGCGFNFPRIVVVGNQSSGKSSIVEAIVGKQFLPRGSDIVTRCPTYIRLHQTPPGSKEYAVFPKEEAYHLEEENMTDFTKVCKEIERRTEKRVGNSKNISHDEICLDIYSPNYPDLQFVDLPGFTKTPVQDQPENIEEQILDMNLRYMKDSNTIILAIQDATQDIGLSEVLKHSQRTDIDPKGKRTVGVLTKLDRLEPGSDTARVIGILENKTKPLYLGYIGVVNRSQNQVDRKIDMETAKQTEKDVVDRPEFARLKHTMGTDYLRQFLTKILAHKMKKMMPGFKKERSDELQQIIDDLINIGYAADEHVDYDDLIAELVEKTVDKVELNKSKADDYLDMIIDMHKRFVNSEHVEFKKMRTLKKGGGIRYKNNFNLWFQEEIPADQTISTTDNSGEIDQLQDASGGGMSEELSESGGESGIDMGVDALDKVLPAVVGPVQGTLMSAGVKAVRGFVDRIQRGNDSKNKDGVHTNRLPSSREDEALFHLDLCLEYMEIVDKQVVDEVPKIFIMMLVYKTLDFLNGGKAYPTSILRKVQKKCRDQNLKEDVLTKSTTHQELINDLLERRRICEETIKVIDETGMQLNLCT